MFRKTTRVTRLLSLLLATLMLLLMLPLSGLADWPEGGSGTEGGDPPPDVTTTLTGGIGGATDPSLKGTLGGTEGEGSGVGGTGDQGGDNGFVGGGDTDTDDQNTDGDGTGHDVNSLGGGQNSGSGDSADKQNTEDADGDDLNALNDGDALMTMSGTSEGGIDLTKIYPSLSQGVTTTGMLTITAGGNTTEPVTLWLYHNNQSTNKYTEATKILSYKVYLAVDKPMYIDIDATKLLPGYQGYEITSVLSTQVGVGVADPLAASTNFYCVEFVNVDIDPTKTSFDGIDLALRIPGGITADGQQANIYIFGGQDGAGPDHLILKSLTPDAYEAWFDFARKVNHADALNFEAVANMPEVNYLPMTGTDNISVDLTLEDLANTDGIVVQAKKSDDTFAFGFTIDTQDSAGDPDKSDMNVAKLYPAVTITAQHPERVDFASEQFAIDLFDFGGLDFEAHPNLKPTVTLVDDIVTMAWDKGLSADEFELLKATKISLKEFVYYNGEEAFPTTPHFKVEYIVGDATADGNVGVFTDIADNKGVIEKLGVAEAAWTVKINFPFDPDSFNPTDKNVDTLKEWIPFHFTEQDAGTDLAAATDYGRKPVDGTTARDFMSNDALMYGHGNRMWFKLGFAQNTQRDGVDNAAVKQIILKEEAGASFDAGDMKIIGFAAGLYSLPENLKVRMTLTVEVTYGDGHVQTFTPDLASETIAFFDGDSARGLIPADSKEIKSIEFIYNNVPNTTDGFFVSEPMVLFEAPKSSDSHGVFSSKGAKMIGNEVFMEYTPFGTTVYTAAEPGEIDSDKLSKETAVPYIKSLNSMIYHNKYSNADDNVAPGSTVKYWLDVAVDDLVNFRVNSVIIRDVMNGALKLKTNADGKALATVHVFNGTVPSTIEPANTNYSGTSAFNNKKFTFGKSPNTATVTGTGITYSDVELMPFEKNTWGTADAEMQKNLVYWGVFDSSGGYQYEADETGFMLLMGGDMSKILAPGGRVVVEYETEVVDLGEAAQETMLENRFWASFYPIYPPDGSGGWDPWGGTDGSNVIKTSPARYAFANIDKQVRKGGLDDGNSTYANTITLKLKSDTTYKNATTEIAEIDERNVVYRLMSTVEGSLNASENPMVFDMLPNGYTFTGYDSANPSAYFNSSVRVMYDGAEMIYGTGYTGEILSSSGTKNDIIKITLKHTLPEKSNIGAAKYFTIEYEATTLATTDIAIAAATATSAQTFAYFEPNAGYDVAGFVAKSGATGYAGVVRKYKDCSVSGYEATIISAFSGVTFNQAAKDAAASAYRYAVRDSVEIKFERTGPKVSLSKAAAVVDGDVKAVQGGNRVDYTVVFENHSTDGSAITIQKIADVLPKGQLPIGDYNTGVTITYDGGAPLPYNLANTIGSGWIGGSPNGILAAGGADQYRWEIDLVDELPIAAGKSVTITYSATVMSSDDLIATKLLEPSSLAYSANQTNTVAVYPINDALQNGTTTWLKPSNQATETKLQVTPTDENGLPKSLKVLTATASVQYMVATIAPNVSKTALDKNGNKVSSFPVPKNDDLTIVGWQTTVYNGANAGMPLSNYEVYDILPFGTYMTAAQAADFNTNTQGVTLTLCDAYGNPVADGQRGTILKFTFKDGDDWNSAWTLGTEATPKASKTLPNYYFTVPKDAMIAGFAKGYVYITPFGGEQFLHKGSGVTGNSENKEIGGDTDVDITKTPLIELIGDDLKTVQNYAEIKFTGSTGANAIKYLSTKSAVGAQHLGVFEGDGEGATWTSSKSLTNGTPLNVKRDDEVYYKFELENTATNPFYTYSVIDVLPRDNDLFAVYDVNRLSKWGPTLNLDSFAVGVLKANGDSLDIADACEIYVTTADANPYTALADWQSSDAKWVLLTDFDGNAAAIKAYRVVVGENVATNGVGSASEKKYALNTGDRLIVTWAMNVPNDTILNATAWNSAAFALWYGNDAQSSSQRQLVQAETDKVGIKTTGASLGIELEKVLVNKRGEAVYSFELEFYDADAGMWVPVAGVQEDIEIAAGETVAGKGFTQLKGGLYRIKEISTEATKNVQKVTIKVGYNPEELALLVEDAELDVFYEFEFTGGNGYIQVTNEYKRPPTIIDPNPDPKPDPKPDPETPKDPEPTDRPEPTDPGNTLEESDDGYFEFDEDGTALGEWTQDEDGEWIFDEFPPLGALQTGDNAAIFIWGGIAVVAIAGLAVIFLKRKRT